MQVYNSVWQRRLGKVDSPIEALFLEAFAPLAIDHGFEIAKRSSAHSGVILVEPQRQIDLYRVDFLISYHFFGTDLALIVECDGHDFHEKTKAQAARDKKRSRYLQRAGYQIFAFTGSELRGDPRGCAMEVLDTIMDFQTGIVVNGAAA